jgi:hypothetical protein
MKNYLICLLFCFTEKQNLNLALLADSKYPELGLVNWQTIHVFLCATIN